MGWKIYELLSVRIATDRQRGKEEIELYFILKYNKLDVKGLENWMKSSKRKINIF